MNWTSDELAQPGWYWYRSKDGRLATLLLREHLYDTEVEADLHGIAFGQRSIDGKVRGLLVG